LPFLIFAILSLITAGIHMLVAKPHFHDAFSILLLHLVVVNCGLAGLFAFLGHTAKADDIAREIGWPTGNPFQQEVAVASLAFSFLGFLSLWFRGDFLVATALGFSIFLLGCGFVHLRDLKKHGNTAKLNAGPMLYYDLLFPLFIVGVVVAYRWR
jgi:hypothetical protein